MEIFWSKRPTIFGFRFGGQRKNTIGWRRFKGGLCLASLIMGDPPKLRVYSVPLITRYIWFWDFQFFCDLRSRKGYLLFCSKWWLRSLWTAPNHDKLFSHTIFSLGKAKFYQILTFMHYIFRKLLLVFKVCQIKVEQIHFVIFLTPLHELNILWNEVVGSR